MSRYHSYMSCGVVELNGHGPFGNTSDLSGLYGLAHSIYRPRVDPEPYSSIGFTAQEYRGRHAADSTRVRINGAYGQYIGPKAFVTWCDKMVGWGPNLEAQINKLGFGPVHRTAETCNPNTGRMITFWVWTIDNDKFKAWYEKEFKDRGDPAKMTHKPWVFPEVKVA